MVCWVHARVSTHLAFHQLPGITEKDSSDIRFGLEQGINYIAASFVRKPEDIEDIRALLKEKNMEDVQIFPKIESQEGIDNFEAIMEVADGLMVPRGDMGVESQLKTCHWYKRR